MNSIKNQQQVQMLASLPVQPQHPCMTQIRLRYSALYLSVLAALSLYGVTSNVQAAKLFVGYGERAVEEVDSDVDYDGGFISGTLINASTLTNNGKLTNNISGELSNTINGDLTNSADAARHYSHAT